MKNEKLSDDGSNSETSSSRSETTDMAGVKSDAPATASEGRRSVKSEARGESEVAGKTTRRSFLARLGVGATLLAIAGQAYAFLRSLVPNVLYESPQRFKAGTTDQFGEGGKFLDEKRVFIFREQNTFYAMSAACTHLGCTVKMTRLNQPKKVKVGDREFEEQVEFQCPCHGSKYYGDGTNYEGPAPRPLDFFKLEVSPDDGQLEVDMSENVGQDFRLTI